LAEVGGLSAVEWWIISHATRSGDPDESCSIPATLGLEMVVILPLDG
jgi:hypothetical protein